MITIRDLLKSATAVLMAGLIAGCNAFKFPTERALYKAACRALRDDAAIAEDARPGPRSEAKFSIARNAAWIELPYESADAGGRKVTGSHTIWFKRVARTWEVSRAFPTPTYQSSH